MKRPVVVQQLTHRFFLHLKTKQKYNNTVVFFLLVKSVAFKWLLGDTNQTKNIAHSATEH
jgi:hypothetical protein